MRFARIFDNLEGPGIVFGLRGIVADSRSSDPPLLSICCLSLLIPPPDAAILSYIWLLRPARAAHLYLIRLRLTTAFDMADQEDSLVMRRSKRSTAGNRSVTPLKRYC